MLGYKKIFVTEIKLLIPNFVEFFDDESMLSKKYPEDCKVSNLNWKPIILMKYDKITVFAKNTQQEI